MDQDADLLLQGILWQGILWQGIVPTSGWAPAPATPIPAVHMPYARMPSTAPCCSQTPHSHLHSNPLTALSSCEATADREIIFTRSHGQYSCLAPCRPTPARPGSRHTASGLGSRAGKNLLPFPPRCSPRTGGTPAPPSSARCDAPCPWPAQKHINYFENYCLIDTSFT